MPWDIMELIFPANFSKINPNPIFLMPYFGLGFDMVPQWDFGPKWLKSFIFTCRMRREREKMDVNRHLKKYPQTRFAIFTTFT